MLARLFYADVQVTGRVGVEIQRPPTNLVHRWVEMVIFAQRDLTVEFRQETAVGRNQHDVSRILGSADVVADAPLTLSQGSDPSQVGNAQAERLVVYSLPDLNSLAGRPENVVNGPL